ncbi:O-methyltransferase [Rugamonas sp. CCM 8940]|uniref:O-methyltransferase n=1 Tax=Rugamonas sp. CCM 8940 TaxID=2765359 RepID=UPI001F342F03|nr:class I SAM-dependent methyltransferase [Rugamonas sp. CCM 8940]
MDSNLKNLLAELEAFGQSNDGAVKERPGRMLNITRDTGELLSVLVRSTGARRILEIGTSNGYSTLWLADAARSVGGTVTTVELSRFKIELAQANFSRSALTDHIRQVEADAGGVLRAAQDDSVDLIFLDSERSEYSGWWPDVRRVLRPGGLLVVDNATSHRDEMAAFMALVGADSQFHTCLVPVGNGEFLATKNR